MMTMDHLPGTNHLGSSERIMKFLFCDGANRSIFAGPSVMQYFAQIKRRTVWRATTVGLFLHLENLNSL
jgi:hypothetical protein